MFVVVVFCLFVVVFFAIPAAVVFSFVVVIFFIEYFLFTCCTEGVVQSDSIASIASTSSATSTHTHQPVLPSSFLSTTSVDSYTVTLSNDCSGDHVVTLSDNQNNVVIDGPLVDRPPTPNSEVIVGGNGEGNYYYIFQYFNYLVIIYLFDYLFN